jgi:septum formation protein
MHGGAGAVQTPAPPLILASASASRRALLAAAGLRFAISRADIDETAVKQCVQAAGGTAAAAALELAERKARAVQRAGALVIGCDQILVCEGAWFDKPPSVDAARTQLAALRGRTHELVTATACVRDGAVVFSQVAVPRLTMRHFSDAFLETYLAREGSCVLTSVGAYRLEGAGMHLFDRVEGEHAAILGLPMLPLLAYFRACGILLE